MDAREVLQNMTAFYTSLTRTFVRHQPPMYVANRRVGRTFFYQFQPGSVRVASPGMLEVTIPHGWGQWAMEIHFSKNDIVDAASWVKQE